MPRLLLLLPRTTYRAEEFMDAASRLSIDVTVGSDHRSTLQSQSPAALLRLDFRHPHRAAAQAQEFARQYPIDAVLGVDDASVEAAAAIADALGLPTNPPDAVRTARDKHRSRTVLAAHGVPVPAFRLASVADDPERLSAEVSCPCVVKPTVLSASRGVIRANDAREFVAAFQRLRDILADPELKSYGDRARQVLIDEYVPGAEVALEGLLSAGQLRTLCLFDKPDPLEGPFFEETLYVTPSRLPEATQRAISDCVQHACTALGLREGPVHAELRVNDRGVWLLEVNPRSIGGRCSRVLRFGTGWSLEDLILRHALERSTAAPPPTPERESCAAGVMMLPIPRGGTLRRVEGASAAQSTPGVAEVLISAHPGQQIIPLPEGAPYLGFVFARGDTPAQVEAALREAHRRLTFVID